jgi:hypothetical protein
MVPGSGSVAGSGSWCDAQDAFGGQIILEKNAVLGDAKRQRNLKTGVILFDDVFDIGNGVIDGARGG